MIYEVWRSEDGSEQAISDSEQIVDMNNKGMLIGMAPFYSIRAATWEEAMQINYDINGWGTYKPM